MHRLKQQWKSLSTESKLGIVVMPIVLAIIAGVVSPLAVDALTGKSTPERRGVVKILDVETNVPLGDFAAQHAAAELRPDEFVLASVEEELPESQAPDDAGSGGDPAAGGEPGGDPGQSDDPGAGGDPGQSGDPGGSGDPGQGDDPGAGDDPGEGDDPGAGDDPGEGDDPGDGGDPDGGDPGDGDDPGDGGDPGDGDPGDGDDPGDGGGTTKDSDNDGVADKEDLCPTRAGNLSNGCVAAQLRTEPFGCADEDMADTLAPGRARTERCEDLSAVLGETSESEPGDVEERAKAVAAALHETRTTKVRGGSKRLEPLGVVITVQVTVTGMEGEEVDVRWALRHANGRRLPHRWLRNRPVMKLTGEAESDTAGAQFWVPLPKRPPGPYFVRVAMNDDEGTPLTFDKSRRIR